MASEGHLKGFPCSFWDDVLCSYKKNDKPTVLSKCLKCERYKRFMREMEEDERIMDRIDEIRKNPDAYQHGES